MFDSDGQPHARTRAGDTCPMCRQTKERGLVVHWGFCYRGSGFKDGEADANAIVDTYETYLDALARLEVTA